MRLAAMKSAGHKEQHIVQLLASDRNYVAGLMASLLAAIFGVMRAAFDAVA